MGSRMAVRFDDSQRWWHNKLGEEQMEAYRAEMTDDLHWLGFDPIYQSDAESFDEVMQFCRGKIPDKFLVDRETYICPSMIPDKHMYPFAPWLTILHVVRDYWSGVRKVIRAGDLVTEHSLYHAFCEMLKIPAPEHWYIPRLQQVVNCGFYSQDMELADVAKSATTGDDWSIHRFREETNARHLIQRLADVCLADRHSPWLLSNLLPRPKVYAGSLL